MRPEAKQRDQVVDMLVLLEDKHLAAADRPLEARDMKEKET